MLRLKNVDRTGRAMQFMQRERTRRRYSKYPRSMALSGFPSKFIV